MSSVSPEPGDLSWVADPDIAGIGAVLRSVIIVGYALVMLACSFNIRYLGRDLHHPSLQILGRGVLYQIGVVALGTSVTCFMYWTSLSAFSRNIAQLYLSISKLSAIILLFSFRPLVGINIFFVATTSLASSLITLKNAFAKESVPAELAWLGEGDSIRPIDTEQGINDSHLSAAHLMLHVIDHLGFLTALFINSHFGRPNFADRKSEGVLWTILNDRSRHASLSRVLQLLRQLATLSYQLVCVLRIFLNFAAIRDLYQRYNPYIHISDMIDRWSFGQLIALLLMLFPIFNFCWKPNLTPQAKKVLIFLHSWYPFFQAVFFAGKVKEVVTLAAGTAGFGLGLQLLLQWHYGNHVTGKVQACTCPRSWPRQEGPEPKSSCTATHHCVTGELTNEPWGDEDLSTEFRNWTRERLYILEVTQTIRLAGRYLHNRALRMIPLRVNYAARFLPWTLSRILFAGEVPGYRRISWKCSCGEDLTANFDNSKPDALEALERRLHSLSKPGTTSRSLQVSVSPTTSNSGSGSTSQGTLGTSQGSTGQLSSSSDQGSHADTSGLSRRNLTSSNNSNSRSASLHRYFELCVSVGEHKVNLGEINISSVATDGQLFSKIQERYQKIRRSNTWTARQPWLFKPDDIFFVHFGVIKRHQVGIYGKPMEIPPPEEVDQGRYHYFECPMQPLPPMPGHIFLHYLDCARATTEPESSQAHAEDIFLNRLPKKLGSSIFAGTRADSTIVYGWGVHIVERPSALAQSLVGIVSALICVIVFGITWAFAGLDTAVGIGQYVTGVLALANAAIYFALQAYTSQLSRR